MLELNVSCPNVETGLVMGADPAETALAVERARPELEKPLIVKLTPNAADPAAVAMAAQDAGADAVSLVNTLKGMALQPDSQEPWLGGGTGGVSGPAIRAIALEQVAAVASRLEIPVVGMGGIASGRHARDFLAAGAAAVAVGTESFRDPAAGRRIAAELAALSLSSEQGDQPRDACDPVWGTARRGFFAECGNFETQPADRSNLLDQNPCKRH
jgi:dihydroorotate dehydrogenase (NAD+) catalytic subunit